MLFSKIVGADFEKLWFSYQVNRLFLPITPEHSVGNGGLMVIISSRRGYYSKMLHYFQNQCR